MIVISYILIACRYLSWPLCLVVFGALTLSLSLVLVLAATCFAFRWHWRLESLQWEMESKSDRFFKCKFPLCRAEQGGVTVVCPSRLLLAWVTCLPNYCSAFRLSDVRKCIAFICMPEIHALRNVMCCPECKMFWVSFTA